MKVSCYRCCTCCASAAGCVAGRGLLLAVFRRLCLLQRRLMRCPRRCVAQERHGTSTGLASSVAVRWPLLAAVRWPCVAAALLLQRKDMITRHPLTAALLPHTCDLSSLSIVLRARPRPLSRRPCLQEGTWLFTIAEVQVPIEDAWRSVRVQDTACMVVTGAAGTASVQTQVARGRTPPSCSAATMAPH